MALTTMTTRGCLLFDWGNTLMRIFPDQTGPMKYWTTIEEIPFAGDALRCLQNQWQLAVATNAEDSEEDDIREVLQKIWPDIVFDQIFCYRRIGCKKPSVGFFHFVQEHVQHPTERIVMIGDDFSADVEGAITAGLSAVWFNPEHHVKPHSSVVFEFHDFRQLPELLNRWFSQ